MAKYDPKAVERLASLQRKKAKEFKKKKEKFLSSFPFGETHVEQKIAYEKIVDILLHLQEDVGSLSSSRRNIQF